MIGQWEILHVVTGPQERLERARERALKVDHRAGERVSGRSWWRCRASGAACSPGARWISAPVRKRGPEPPGGRAVVLCAGVAPLPRPGWGWGVWRPARSGPSGSALQDVGEPGLE